jgi:hypothetical protein
MPEYQRSYAEMEPAVTEQGMKAPVDTSRLTIRDKIAETDQIMEEVNISLEKILMFIGTKGQKVGQTETKGPECLMDEVDRGMYLANRVLDCVHLLANVLGA